MTTYRWLLGALVLVGASALLADGPGDNIAEKVRPVPPPGVKIAAGDRQELETGVAALGKEIADLRALLASKPALLELLPDVQIYHNAVRYALANDEFYNLNEVAVARKFLTQGMERAKELREGKSSWTTKTGLVVRGYVSKIDGSVQPYGLVVPKEYVEGDAGKYRLDVWCHGRGETLSELSFLNGRQSSPGEFAPAHAIVLHLYGRYCNANKFAGEIDCLEALAHVEKHYPIDEYRRVIRGFSMGGAACWQFAVHYPSLWCAAAPGAGFSETADFLKVFQKEIVKPTDFEQKLWHVYDCTDYAGNLFNLPTVAYSGEKDSQKQAADMMESAMKKEGLTLLHLIGPGAGHFYNPVTKKELNRRIDRLAERGRELVPNRIKFTTYTLRYDRSFWLRIDGLARHWERADVDANLIGADGAIEIHTKNVTAFTLEMDSGDFPLDASDKPKVTIDDEELEGAPVLSDKSWKSHFRKKGDTWEAVEKPDETGLAKRHGLQGPIDDAFMDSFLIVKPSGKPMNDTTGAWADAEMKRAIDQWRKQFRGEARVKADSDVTWLDVAQHNLILWGDPASNGVLGNIADKLPIKWGKQSIEVNRATFDVENHVAVMIYPNPLNPNRYIVVNSGFTFRDYDYLNNARQIPKLPDYAVVDVRTPPSPRWPGKVVKAGFFDEKWRFPTLEK